MKTKLSTLKEFLGVCFQEYLESVDRANRGEEDDYRDEDDQAGVRYEEDVDRLRRAADGYGETEFEEAVEEDLELENTNCIADESGKGTNGSQEVAPHTHPEDEDVEVNISVAEVKLPKLSEIFGLSPDKQQVKEAKSNPFSLKSYVGTKE